MISAGDGTLVRHAAVGFRGFMLERRTGGAGPVRPRPVGVTAAIWRWPEPGATRARPPAVAVTGLRRSGRTGNGESPAGGSRPPASQGRSVHSQCRYAAACPKAHAPSGARRAPRALEEARDTYHQFSHLHPAPALPTPHPRTVLY
jgi:hypothetical protein